MKRTTQKLNWWRCSCCNASVLTRKVRGSGEIVRLAKTPVYIILDATSSDTYYYNGEWVQGREVQDGLIAYRKHKCNIGRK